jgi:hypothetical protein
MIASFVQADKIVKVVWINGPHILDDSENTDFEKVCWVTDDANAREDSKAVVMDIRLNLP